jgi:tetratricopeptide (TPR) repeat protein
MIVKYPENFLTLRWRREPSVLISQEYASLYQLRQTAVDKTDANMDSNLKLLEIEGHLTKAHELYFKHQYQQALDEYKSTQGLIYQLLDVSFPLATAQRPEIEFPVNKNIFSPLITSSLEFVEALALRTTEASFGPAFINVDENLTANLTPYGQLGINPADNIPRNVTYDSQLALTYAERGQWSRAEYFYKRAQTNLGSPDTQEKKTAKAALDLNLGGIYIQMGKTTLAKTFLEQASAGFKETHDAIGEAQAKLNMAAVVTKEGKTNEATTLLKEADQLIKTAKGTPQTSPSPSDSPTVLRTATATRITLGPAVRAETTVAPVAERIATISGTRIATTKPETLSTLPEAQGTAITYRQPTKGAGWTQQQVETQAESTERIYAKELGLLVGGTVLKVKWTAGTVVPAQQIISNIYEWRIAQKSLKDVIWPHQLPSDFAVQLPHIYLYVIPVAMGDCYHALGEYSTAEACYLKAADYQYINENLEIPNLWKKIAENVSEWGDMLYKDDEYEEALNIYHKVLEPPGTASVIWQESPLYKHPKLKLVGDTVEAMLTNYAVTGVGDMNPSLAAVIFEIRAKIMQLHAGLDFLGMPANIVPIWSFDYLQNVARYFTQQAILAEREFVNFWDKAENEALTRQQLMDAQTLGEAEYSLAIEQREAAEAEKQVYVAGEDLAKLRAQNSAKNRNDYANLSSQRIYYDAAIATLGAGSNVDWGTIEEHIRRLQEEGRTSGERGQLIGARTLARGRMTQEYELKAMDRQTAELQQGVVMAKAQSAVADARVDVAKQMEEVARLRKEAAANNLAAFNNQFFTPEVWYSMGSFMRSISKSYLFMAIRIARMMQQAYNFENDLHRHFIKTNYSMNTLKGLLAGDALLLDIDSFTYDLLTTIKRKEIPMKQTISLAERYAYLFETELRRTGKMEFETRIEDFDLSFPGTYGRRIESLEIEIEGMLPKSGVKGTLTNCGISRYRTTDINRIKFRIQPKETLLLSEYRIKEDAIVFPADPRTLKIFEGAGVTGSWILEIPRSTNDIDYNSITDIRLTFYYHTRFDSALETAVKANLNTYAALNLRSRTVPLRWAFPDSFFHFQDTGKLSFLLDPMYFSFNEVNPKIRNISILIVTENTVDPTAWKIRLGVPAHPDTISASPNSDGEITAEGPWQPLATGTAIGDYTFEIRADENPELAENGTLKLDNISNIILILEYEYTPRV